MTENVQTIPPPYVIRTILVYSRPPCQPQFSLTEPMKASAAGRREGGRAAHSRHGGGEGPLTAGPARLQAASQSLRRELQNCHGGMG